jgi:Cu/Zn superoxide dismutase
MPSGVVRGAIWSSFMRVRVAALAALAGIFIAGCSMLRSTPAQPASATAPVPDALGQVAVLRAIGGSAVAGKIRVVDRGDGAAVLISAINLAGRFRIAIHETPNCTSPNGFSAGPVWAPPAAGKRAEDLVPVQYADAEGNAEISLRVAGLRAGGINGVAGHSVVVYAGGDVTEARPDQPNARIACGVFEPAQPLAF